MLDLLSANCFLIFLVLTCNFSVFSIWHLNLSGILGTALAVLFIGFLAWAYKVIQPPPPKICGTPDGPPITAPRIKLRDGRHLAYKEHGVSKDAAMYKIIYVHGFDNCRHDAVLAEALSPVIIDITSLSLSYHSLISVVVCTIIFKMDFSRVLLRRWGSTFSLLTDLVMGKVILIQNVH